MYANPGVGDEGAFRYTGFFMSTLNLRLGEHCAFLRRNTADHSAVYSTTATHDSCQRRGRTSLYNLMASLLSLFSSERAARPFRAKSSSL